MPSSVTASYITTAVPDSLLKLTPHWCIQELLDFDDQPNACTNTTAYPGEQDSDFDTICCDGNLVDVTQNLYQWPRPKNYTLSVDLANLLCCRVKGPQQGGIQPIGVDDGCTLPVPLASLAATNTANAALYPVTYTSASYGTATTGDYIPTATPTCLWVNTVTTSSGFSMRNVTVEAAHITTPPPATTDRFGFPVTTTSTASAFSMSSVTPTTSTMSATSSAAAPSDVLPNSSFLGMLALGMCFLARG